MLETRKETARTMRDNAKPVRIEMDEAAARRIRQENAKRFAAFASRWERNLRDAETVNVKSLWDA